MCSSCPPLFMVVTENISTLCSNWENVIGSFAISLDSQKQVNDIQTTISHCTRTVRCIQPYMLVKWHESNVCDVHMADEKGSFDYKCNGTHWTMQGFPIDSITCGQKN
uniref:Sushi domain-containing protein n=1 Tax=Heterorhabditis bacteriophora TaxID=37862 RepID=A0A1I7XR76_HETBA